MNHSPRRESFESFSKDMQLQVNAIVSVVRWSWKGHSQWHWGRISSFAQFFRRKSFELFSRETEIQAILLGDRALSQCNSLSGQIVLKRQFLSETVEGLAHLIWSWGQRAFSHSSGRQSFEPFCQEMKLQVDVVVLVARWSQRGHLWLTLGKTQLICSSLTWDRADLVNKIGLLKDCLTKDVQGSLFTFVQVSQETYLTDSIQ